MTDLAGASPEPQDIDAAELAAAALGWALDWSRDIGDNGIRWKLRVTTARGPLYVTGDSSEHWHEALAMIGLVE